MAALALESALEAMLYAYFIIWTGDEDPAKDQRIPGDLALLDVYKRQPHMFWMPFRGSA